MLRPNQSVSHATHFPLCPGPGQNFICTTEEMVSVGNPGKQSSAYHPSLTHAWNSSLRCIYSSDPWIARRPVREDWKKLLSHLNTKGKNLTLPSFD